MIKKHVPHTLYTAAQIRLALSIPSETKFVLFDQEVSRVLRTYNGIISALKQIDQPGVPNDVRATAARAVEESYK